MIRLGGDHGDSIVDFITSYSFMNATLRNPVYFAILVVIMVFMIIVFVTYNMENVDELYTKLVRSAFYSVIVVIGAVYLHSEVMKKEYIDKYDSGSSNVFGAGIQSKDRLDPGYLNVQKDNFDFGDINNIY